MGIMTCKDSDPFLDGFI